MAAFWVKSYRGMRLPFWNVFLSSQWPPFPVPVSWHMHVQIHFSWREDPLLLSLCSCWACSLFYEMPLTLAHIPSISRSCTDACPEPYGCAFIWSHLWRSHLAAFSHRGPGGGDGHCRPFVGSAICIWKGLSRCICTDRCSIVTDSCNEESLGIR